MALKRSGVRASSAPFSDFNGTTCGFRSSSATFHPSHDSSIFVPHWTCHLALLCRLYLRILCLLAVSSGSASCQTGASGRNGPKMPPVDAVVLVRAVSAGACQVSVSYRLAVPHGTVNEDLSRLAKATSGAIDGLVIEDESFRPEDKKHYPVTTSASFVLRNAPFVRDNTPALLPYLKAFQRWNIVEVIFAGPGLANCRGVLSFENPAVSVKLLQQDAGIFRYRAEIRDHQGELPQLPTGANVGAAPAGAVQDTTHPGARGRFAYAIIAVLVLFGVIGGSLWYWRRLPSG